LQNVQDKQETHTKVQVHFQKAIRVPGATIFMPPQLYGLPKIHKEAILLRPSLKSWFANTLSNEQLARILPPLPPHFVQCINQIQSKVNDRMMSLDVVSLVSMVLPDEALQVISLLRENESLEGWMNIPPDEICKHVKICLHLCSLETNTTPYMWHEKKLCWVGLRTEPYYAIICILLLPLCYPYIPLYVHTYYTDVSRSVTIPMSTHCKRLEVGKTHHLSYYARSKTPGPCCHKAVVSEYTLQFTGHLENFF